MIETTITKIQYTADGTQRRWSIPFPYADKKHISIYTKDGDEPTVKVVDNYDIDEDDAVVIYPTVASEQEPLASGTKITIARETPETQLEDSSQIHFTSKDVERGLDKLTMITQELNTTSGEIMEVSAAAFEAAEEAVTTANEANSTANEAKTLAEQAVSTANDAKTAADNAVTKATNAETVAAASDEKSSAAVSKANTAISTANTAKGTTDEALSVANEAKNIASAAKTIAQSAENTANAADKKSDNAVEVANNAKQVADGIDAKATTALENSKNAVATANTAKATADVVDAKATKAMTDSAEALEKATEAKNTADSSQLQITTIKNDIDDLGDQVAAIEGKIPQAASDSNQLVDKASMTSAIAEVQKGVDDNSGDIAALRADLAGKQDKGDYATNAALTNGLNQKADKADSLSGYGITDAFTKEEVNAGLEKKADKATTYTKTEVDNAINTLQMIKWVDALPATGETKYLYAVAREEVDKDGKKIAALYLWDGTGWRGAGAFSLNIDPATLATKTDLAGYLPLSSKAVANGVASLDESVKVPVAQIPDLSSTYATINSLSTVATSGSYKDLTNKPTIPTVNNGTLTVQKNGTNVATFTANQSTASTANIEVPTKLSELTDDLGSSPVHTHSQYSTVANTVTNVVAGSTADKINVTKNGSTSTITINNVANAANATKATKDSDGNTISTTYAKKSTLATVATTGMYSDLTGTPGAATADTLGLVKPDGNTITVTEDGTISATGGSGSGFAFEGTKAEFDAAVAAGTITADSVSLITDDVSGDQVASKAELAAVETASAKADLSNIPTAYDYVVETILPTDSNPRWARIWKSGWVEQGGISGSIAGGAQATVILLKPYRNTLYSVMVQPIGAYTASGEANNTIPTRTKTNFVIACGQASSQAFAWMTTGMGAN